MLLMTENYVRCNKHPFMNNDLRKSTMTQTAKLLNKYSTNNINENLFIYK